MISTAELLSGLGTYLADQQLAQYSSDGQYTEDPGRPGVRMSDADHPDTLLVLAIVGVDRGLFEVAMHFRAGRDASLVDALADSIAEHFHEVFIESRRFVNGTIATPMPSVALDGGLVIGSCTRKTRGAVTIAAPKAQTNANRFARTDVYSVSVSRS